MPTLKGALSRAKLTARSVLGMFDRRVHVFDNGIKVRRRHLIPTQLERYAKINLHEPEEEKAFLEAFRRLKAGDVFLDVGAAIGYYSLLAVKSTPGLEVRAFEPQRRMCGALAENIALNGARGIAIEPLAVAEAEGTCAIGGGFGAAISGGGEIPQTTLAKFIERMGRPAALVKLDIQGAELRAIEGARGAFEKIGAWIVGTHSPELHRDCMAALREAGYEILYEDPAPEGQPDGIIHAARRGRLA